MISTPKPQSIHYKIGEDVYLAREISLRQGEGELEQEEGEGGDVVAAHLLIHRLVQQVEDEAVSVAGVEEQARVRVLVVAGGGQPPRRPRAPVPLTAPAIQSSVFLHAANRKMVSGKAFKHVPFKNRIQGTRRRNCKNHTHLQSENRYDTGNGIAFVARKNLLRKP